MSSSTTHRYPPVYPVSLVHLDQVHSIIVGGGPVAERKAKELLVCNARITLISPTLTPTLEVLVQEGAIEHLPRPYRAGDLKDAFLVIAASDNSSVNEAVWQEAINRKILINAADDPAHCNVLMPAVIRQGPLAIAISTGGRSPALAARLRREIAALIGPAAYEEFLELLGDLRDDITANFPTRCRKTVWNALIDSDILEHVGNGNVQTARSRVAQILSGCIHRNQALSSIAGHSLVPPPNRCPLCQATSNNGG